MTQQQGNKATQPTPTPTRKTFSAGQYVKVQVTATKAEIGQIEDLDDQKARIATASGFAVSRPISSLTPAMLVVCDLNGVLGFRKRSKVMQKRPHVDELLSFLFKNFVVGVWTSCTEQNGVRIVQDIFAEREQRLLFQLYRDACTPNPTVENRHGTFKDLRRVWERYPCFGVSNTIMIDDSEDKCSHRHNALCPTPYVGGENDQAPTNDDGLIEIMQVLEQVVKTNTLAPLRTHMVARWGTSGSNTPQTVPPVADPNAFPSTVPKTAAQHESEEDDEMRPSLSMGLTPVDQGGLVPAAASASPLPPVDRPPGLEKPLPRSKRNGSTNGSHQASPQPQALQTPPLSQSPVPPSSSGASPQESRLPAPGEKKINAGANLTSLVNAMLKQKR